MRPQWLGAAPGRLIIKRAAGRGGFGECFTHVRPRRESVALKLILQNLEVGRRGYRDCWA